MLDIYIYIHTNITIIYNVDDDSSYNFSSRVQTKYYYYY